MKYVIGFAFNEVGDEVLLIRKNRPTWQEGKLNGIGGKIEQGEEPLAALVREFQEEVGVTTLESDWRPFGKLQGADFIVYLYTTRNHFIYDASSMTDEMIRIIPVKHLWAHQLIPNLVYLVPMALDTDTLFCDIHYR